ncbi:MAG: hypothetical protein JKX91_07150 [Rhizobiaceae bacterium]|nr:hypothetical protein [Rhizobiaceae bacterium]
MRNSPAYADARLEPLPTEPVMVSSRELVHPESVVKITKIEIAARTLRTGKHTKTNALLTKIATLTPFERPAQHSHTIAYLRL